ncbi:uncharacterized protein LOC110106550 [Dendrobium catenatum]|uniref:uncharacterized protein LOC110106550 n=1 Tax=Dendrobium catenatum TaxID=906689 RepID=UPI0009F34144|nr:uncharacterized protein LOC110106550 [Dendrobium catenatum]
MSSPAYEGGSGGYIKRRLFKNSARTPYERPPSAARAVRSIAAVKGNDGRWLPTFMEPVSRFITRTACRLLSSVLPKRLSAPSGVEEKHLVMIDTPAVILAEQIKLADCHSLITSKSVGISDIEQFISQRWFTRKVLFLLFFYFMYHAT